MSQGSWLLLVFVCLVAHSMSHPTHSAAVAAGACSFLHTVPLRPRRFPFILASRCLHAASSTVPRHYPQTSVFSALSDHRHTAKSLSGFIGSFSSPRHQDLLLANSLQCVGSCNEFMFACADLLSDSQITKLLNRIGEYRKLKSKPPPPRSRLALLRDVTHILAAEPPPNGDESRLVRLVSLLSRCMDIVDVASFSTITSNGVFDMSSLSTNRSYDASHDLDDHTPCSTLQMLQARALCGGNEPLEKPTDSEQERLLKDSRRLGLSGRDLVNREPVGTTLKTKRIGDVSVRWDNDPRVLPMGNLARNMVFISNVPAGPQKQIEEDLRQAFKHCGEIVSVELNGDRLRTIDQTSEASLASVGDKVTEEKIRNSYSPVFGLVEFSTPEAKDRACNDSLRAFGVWCVNRLVYPERAERKTSLVASNMPFQISSLNAIKMFAYGLVCPDEEQETSIDCLWDDPKHVPTSDLRLLNPEVFSMPPVRVRAAANVPEPWTQITDAADDVDEQRRQQAAYEKDCEEAVRRAKVGYGYSGPVEGHDLANEAAKEKKESLRLGSLGRKTGSAEGGGTNEDRNLATSILASQTGESGNELIPDSRVQALFQSNASVDMDEAVHIPYDPDEISGTLTKHFSLTDHSEAIGRQMRFDRWIESDAQLQGMSLTRQVHNTDGVMVLRFQSFEHAYAAFKLYKSLVILDTRTLVLFSPRRCLFKDGKFDDLWIGH
eukprot:GHVS01104817.1.p1 GENE.GHVS01104817.1~~GHVS01104817.1.p1  ORF type:complete len:719 (+),score=54.20 GHVS01104817.1:107-2263(+)